MEECLGTLLTGNGDKSPGKGGKGGGGGGSSGKGGGGDDKTQDRDNGFQGKSLGGIFRNPAIDDCSR